MARPTKNTVDYFPHLIGSGKKMQYIEMKYGNDGYAVWFKILETLATTENHFLNLNKDIDLMFLSAKTRVSVDILLTIIDDLVLLEVLNAKAWEKRIIWSETFMNSIQDAYKRRESKTHDFASLCKHLLSLGIHIECNNPVNVDINAGKERKGKEIKGEERKGEENNQIEVVENHPEIPIPNAWGKYNSMDDVKAVLLSSTIWHGVYAKSAGIRDSIDITLWLENFFNHALASGKDHRTLEEAKSHCLNWTRKQIESGKKPEESRTQTRTEQPQRLSAIARANLAMEERMRNPQRTL